MLALRQTEWQRVNLKTTALETLYGGEIVLSTYLVKRNHPVILSHQRSATVSLAPVCHRNFDFLPGFKACLFEKLTFEQIL